MTIRNIDRTGNPLDLLTTEEAAAVLGVSARYFTTRRSSGALSLKPAETRGSKNYFARCDVWAAAEATAAGRVSGPCAIPGCTRRGRVSRDGLCLDHRAIVEQNGTRDGLRGTPPSRPSSLTTLERFETYVSRGTGTSCDVWGGSRSGSGYGTFRLDRTRPAHVVAFELENGRPVRAGYEIDHRCENELCVRVGDGHVVEATHAENVERRTASYWARKAAAAQTATVVPLFPVVTPAQMPTAA